MFDRGVGFEKQEFRKEFSESGLRASPTNVWARDVLGIED